MSPQKTQVAITKLAIAVIIVPMISPPLEMMFNKHNPQVVVVTTCGCLAIIATSFGMSRVLTRLFWHNSPMAND